MSRSSVSRTTSKRAHSTTKAPSPRQTHVSSSGSAWAAADAAYASKMGHSPSHATTLPVEMKRYNELRKDIQVQKAIKARDKLGELLGRPLRYGATKQEIDDRTAKIMKYEQKVKKYDRLLGEYDQAKVDYDQLNLKLKGGKSVRRNNTIKRRKGTRRFRR